MVLVVSYKEPMLDVIFYIGDVLSNTIINPIIKTQPRLFVTYYLSNEANQNSLRKYKANWKLSIQFEIEYKNILNKKDDIETFVMLKRYPRKQNETQTYIDDEHKPIIIPLPKKGETINGFKFEGDFSLSKINDRTQMFSWEAITRASFNDLNVLIKDFVDLLDLGDKSEITKFAFKFIIEINQYFNKYKQTKVLITNLFFFKLEENCLALEYAEEDEFFMEKDNVEGSPVPVKKQKISEKEK